MTAKERKDKRMARLPKTKQQQIGIIMAGAGLNMNQWIQDAKAAGYAVVQKKGYTEVWTQK